MEKENEEDDYMELDDAVSILPEISIDCKNPQSFEECFVIQKSNPITFKLILHKISIFNPKSSVPIITYEGDTVDFKKLKLASNTVYIIVISDIFTENEILRKPLIIYLNSHQKERAQFQMMYYLAEKKTVQVQNPLLMHFWIYLLLIFIKNLTCN